MTTPSAVKRTKAVPIDQAPVVQTLDSATLWINHYPLDNSIGFASVYPLDSNLSGGQRYPSFEQLGPEGLGSNPDHCNFVSLLSTPQVLGHSVLNER